MKLFPQRNTYDSIEVFKKRYFGIILQPRQIEGPNGSGFPNTDYEEYAELTPHRGLVSQHSLLKYCLHGQPCGTELSGYDRFVNTTTG